MATQLQRQHIYGLQNWLLSHNHQVGYIQHRPMETAGLSEQDLWNLFAKHSGVVITPDCSEMFTMIYRFAGLKPPAGPSFPYSSGLGNSEDIWKYMPRYTDPAGAHTGAGVAYGVDGGTHIAMVMDPDPGGNPWLFSHGGTNGPIRVRYNDLLASFPAGTPVALLNPNSL